MSQLMLQAPGSQNAGTGTWQDIRFSGRAVEQNAIRYDGIEGSAIIDAAPGNLNGEIPTPFKLQASLENVQEFRVESSNYPAEYGTGTGGQVSVVTKSGGNAFHGSVVRVPPQRRVSTRRTTSTHANDGASGAAEVAARAAPVRRIGRRADREEPRVLLRQLRGLPARRRLQLRRGRAERRGVGARRAGDRGAAAGLHCARARSSCPASRRTPTSTSRSCRRTQHVRENAFSGRLDFKLNDSWSSYVRVFHDQGTSDQPEGVSGRVVHITDNPTNAVFNLQGMLSDTDDQRVQVRLQRGADAHHRPGAGRQRRRLQHHRHQPQRLGRQHRHRRPGRHRPASSCRAAWCAPTARPTATASRTTRTR